MSKVWAANGLVIAVAVALSLYLVLRLTLHIPVAGSKPIVYGRRGDLSVFRHRVGIFLGTVERSMPQLGLFYMLVYLPMNMLLGGNTPLESMPLWLPASCRSRPRHISSPSPVDSLSWCRAGRGVAAVPCGRRHRALFFGLAICVSVQSVYRRSRR
jgi:hypothetical protein